MSRGVTYTAWGSGIAEAERSAVSARAFGLKTCLIAGDYQGSVFDRVVKTEYPPANMTERIFVYPLSPFDQTLYLDSDTLVLGDLSYGFDMAARFGLAVSFAPACFLRWHWGSMKEYGVEDFPEDTVEYNAGVIFFDKHHRATEGLWEAAQYKLAKGFHGVLENRPSPPVNDQSIFNLVLYEKKIHPFVLPQNWNFRPGVYLDRGLPVPSGFGPIKIWHSRLPVPDGFNVRQTGFWKFPQEKGVRP
jgi:hypothetical protein